MENMRKKMHSRLTERLFLGLCVMFLAVGCSKDDDDDNTTTNNNNSNTTSEYLKPGNDTRPEWAVDESIYRTYESYMSVQLTLQDTLLDYLSEQDLMCATIAGEVRAVTPPMHTGDIIYFPLIIPGSNENGKVTVNYYCDKLHRIYSLPDWSPFLPSMAPTQNGLPYVINFIPIGE